MPALRRRWSELEDQKGKALRFVLPEDLLGHFIRTVGGHIMHELVVLGSLDVVLEVTRLHHQDSRGHMVAAAIHDKVSHMIN